jgi:subtilisin family serine protease
LNFVTPGTRIHTTDITGSGGYDSGDYMTHFNGTSSACPHAAGIAALIRAVNPALTNAQVLALMEETADDIEDLGYDDFTGYGRLNAHAALSQIAGGFFVSADSIGFGDVEVNSSDTLSFFYHKPIPKHLSMLIFLSQALFLAYPLPVLSLTR